MAITDANPLLDALRADLLAFADPGEPVELTNANDDWVRATWTQNGRQQRADFRVGTEVSFLDSAVRQNGRETSYGAFIAGPDMADLRAVARNTAAVLGSNVPFVPPLSLFGDGEQGPADEVLRTLASPSEERTAVVFLTADAGDGKTTLLRYAAVDRARAYLAGQASQVWLYVDAQGSRLARLDQALAQAIDEVRAPFPYHATASLVRTGALAIVIDGFDELIGTTGSYDEAYGSLSSFLESLSGAGVVVAAARSAYYEQEFATRVNRSIGFASESWELKPLRLLDWTVDQRQAYVEAVCLRDNAAERCNEIKSQLEVIFEDPQLADLAGKPLFVSRVAHLLLDGDSLATGKLPLDRLVNAYVDREVREKLLAPDGRPLVDARTFKALLAELAEEMWREEATSLSASTVRELMALFAELYGLTDDARDVLVERLPYAAFLTTGHGTTGIRFEHELFFAYFLVQTLVEALRTESPFTLAQALRRGRLPPDAALLAGREMRPQDPATVIARLSEGSKRAGTPVARQNAGAVVVGLALEQTPLAQVAIEHLDFVDMDMRPLALEDVVIRDVELSGVDLRGTTIRQSRGEQVRLRDVVVDGNTRLELEGLPLTAIASVVTFNGARSTHFAPSEVRDILHMTGLPSARRAPSLRNVSESAVELLEQLMRSYRRTNLITESDPDVARNVVGDLDWPTLKQVLLTSGVLHEERRAAGGNKVFYRIRVRPIDVLAGQDIRAEVPSEVTELWNLLEDALPPE